jgi:hypothetical protein
LPQQEECRDLSDVVGELLYSLYMPYLDGFNCDNLRSNSIFNPVYDPNLAFPSHKPIYQHLLYRDKYVQWILYGLLLCPSQLARDDVVELMKLVVSDGFCLPVFREMSINYHDEIETLFGWFPSKTLFPNVKITKYKPKKLFGDLARTTVVNAGQNHKERTSFIVGELTNLWHLFRSCPGLLAPKFSMALSLLSMARAEVEWYLLHHTAEIPTRVKGKSKAAATYELPQFTSLVRLLHDTTALLRQQYPAIQRYYTEYLLGADRADLVLQLEAVRAKFSAGSPEINKTLSELVPDLDALQAVLGGQAAVPGMLHGLRMKLLRVSAYFTSKNAGSGSLDVPGVKALLARVATVGRHALYVDSTEALVREFASLQQIWWFPAQLSAEFERAMHMDAMQPHNAVAVVKVVADAEFNLHHMCPEEQKDLGREMVQRAQVMMERLAEVVVQSLTPICNLIERMENTMSPMEAAHRIERKQKDYFYPGFESEPANRVTITPLVKHARDLAEMCCGVSRAPEVRVYDCLLRPAAFVRDAMVRAMEKQIRRVCHPEGLSKADSEGAGADSGDGGTRPGLGSMLRPTQIVQKLRCFNQAVQQAALHLSISMADLARPVWIKDTFDHAISPVAELLPVNAESQLPEDSLARRMASFYVTMLNSIPAVNDPAVSPLCYSDFVQAFVRVDPGMVPAAGGAASAAAARLLSGSGGLQYELYTSPAEMMALCRLIGPQGVRVIDVELLKIVSEQAKEVKRILLTNRTDLRRFQEEHSKPKWVEAFFGEKHNGT